MLELLGKNVIGERLDAHTAKCLERNEAAKGLWKKLLTSKYFMSPIATFARRAPDSALEHKNCSTAVAPKGTYGNFTGAGRR